MMDMKHLVLAYLNSAEVELQSQRNLLSYDLRVLRDLVDVALTGNIHDLHQVGNSANRIIEMHAVIGELNHKIAQFKEMLEEVEYTKGENE